MVNFDDSFRVRMKERMARFSMFDQRGNVTSKVSVTVKKGDNLLSETKPENQDFTWASDENGPSPLSYFISSLGMCQMVHYAERAGSMNIRIDDLVIKVDGKFTISRPRFFTEIEYFVDIKSHESFETIRELVKSAASDCYVTNTLSKACDVKGFLILNGVQSGEINQF
jgi:uncharacterized OsmC-like protein